MQLYFCNSFQCLYALVGEIKCIYLFITCFFQPCMHCCLFVSSSHACTADYLIVSSSLESASHYLFPPAVHVLLITYFLQPYMQCWLLVSSSHACTADYLFPPALHALIITCFLQPCMRCSLLVSSSHACATDYLFPPAMHTLLITYSNQLCYFHEMMNPC